MELMCNFLPGDPRLVEQIVKELKSQGIFDQFRKECISDVDTKPAYQNLRQRVEGSVFSFLKEQTWNPDMNKNQVREMLRKHIHESGFLETGVERIVDQVVNPKINSVFLPKVDDVMYKFLGIERPKEKISSSTERSTLHDLLPKDLEAISPEVPEDKDFSKEDINKNEMVEASSNLEVNDELKINQEENSIDSQFSALSGIVSHDSNNSLKQDSVMSLNGSESRTSPTESNLRIELEDTSLSHKSSDSNSKSELLGEGKNFVDNNIESKDKEGTINLTENFVKSSEESKSKSKDKRKEKHHSSSDKSKPRNEKEKDKSRSEKHKKDEKDGKTEEKRYKIPKISDKNKDNKSKEKEHRSDKGKSEKDRSDKDKKYDKDKKSKHSSDKDSLNNDKTKRDHTTEKKEKDDKREKKETSKSEKNRDDKRSSSSKKRESSKNNHREKDKDRSTKIHKEETNDKGKNTHCSSSSRKDSKDRKDEDKSKSSHKKNEKNDKEDRKRKRRSKDDHYSSKEKRSGGRSSDRDSDGPSSSKKLHASPQTSSADSLSEQKNQESSGLNSEGSSGYSGNSDKIEDKNEEAGNNALMEMQKIKVPKFASNLNEAMKIMKIRKLLKKLDGIIKTNPSNPEVQILMKEIEELTKDVKREKKEQKEKTEDIEEIDSTQKTETSATASINIDEFISSSNISMAKWNALEAKFMEQISDVDYNSYESPYMDDEETSVIKPTICSSNNEFQGDFSSNETEESGNITKNATTIEIKPENEISKEFRKNDCCKESSTVAEHSIENKDDLLVEAEELNVSHSLHVIKHVSEQTTGSEFRNFQELNINKPESTKLDSLPEVNNLITGNFKDFKQRAIVLLHKHELTEEMIKIQHQDTVEDSGMDNPSNKTDKSMNIFEIEKENIGVNTRKDELNISVENADLLENNDKYYDKSGNDKVNVIPEKMVEGSMNLQNFNDTFTKELTENNVVAEESISQNIQNSCEVCLDSRGDLCRGLEPPENLRPLNFLQCIINILENEISKSKKTMEDYYIINQDNYVHQTRKRKVNEKKNDVSNNNLDTTTSKRLEVQDMEMNPKNVTPSSQKVNLHTKSKMRAKLSHMTLAKNFEEMNVDNKISEMNIRKPSGVRSQPEGTDKEVEMKSTRKSIDSSGEKKNRNNQRYSSEDLYKPRIHLRRSGRDLNNP